jgi:hypothetical protein
MREMIHQNASGTTELASSAEQMSTQAERFQQLVSRFALNGSERRETGFTKKKKFTTKPGDSDEAGIKASGSELHVRAA